MRSVVSLMLVFFLLLAIAPGRAAQPTEADWEAIRSVISRQLEAFQRDDGEAAFAFAAPSIREQFSTAEAFMQMVRAGYGAVYRPRTTAFLPPIPTQAGPVQPVEVTDQDGEVRIALYLMQRQPDGEWKIAGCVLASPQGKSI